LSIVEFSENRSIKIYMGKNTKCQMRSAAAATLIERQFSTISSGPAVSSLLRPGTGALQFDFEYTFQGFDVWNFSGA
jgi:hypothetical protein